MKLRDLPSVDELARDERLAGEPPTLAVAAARSVLARVREEIAAGHEPGDLVARTLAELAAARAPRLRRALNATGVIVHTNLGRAPLPDAALARALGSPAARSRHDEPDARSRLRARDRSRDRGAAARPPVELPRRRVHRAAD